MLQCVAVCCNVLKCVAMCCSELQCVAVSLIMDEERGEVMSGLSKSSQLFAER